MYIHTFFFSLYLFSLLPYPSLPPSLPLSCNVTVSVEMECFSVTALQNVDLVNEHTKHQLSWCQHFHCMTPNSCQNLCVLPYIHVHTCMCLLLISHAASVVCEYGGEQLALGDSIPADDGCNTWSVTGFHAWIPTCTC